MTCLITGCDLVDLHGRCWVHGDLHKIGYNYVFNACLHNKTGETAWQYSMPPSGNAKQLELGISLLGPLQFFERRGVITFPTVFGRLNEVALAYLGRTAT